MARSIAKDHASKRRAILRTAARIFANEGYGRAAMSAVSSACGISKANIYHYYPSKEALLFDILETHLMALRDRVCGLDFASADPADQLEAIMAELLLAYEGADAEHAVQLNAITALPEPEREVLRGYQRDLVRFVRLRVAQLAPGGLGENGAALHSLTMSVFALVNWHFQWNASASQSERRDYARLMRHTLLQGLTSLTPDMLPETCDNQSM